MAIAMFNCASVILSPQSSEKGNVMLIGEPVESFYILAPQLSPRCWEPTDTNRGPFEFCPGEKICAFLEAPSQRLH